MSTHDNDGFSGYVYEWNNKVFIATPYINIFIRGLFQSIWRSRASSARAEYFYWNELSFNKRWCSVKFSITHSWGDNVLPSQTTRTPREWADLWLDTEYKCNNKALEYKEI